MSRATTIAGAWAELESTVMSDAATQLERDEMRYAFYAGAIFCFHALVLGGEPGEESEAAGERIQALNRELLAFHAEIAALTRRRA